MVLTENQKDRETLYPLEGRINGIVMIAGNKKSTIPSEIYSMRGEAFEWWWEYGKMIFNVYGTPPWATGDSVEAGTTSRIQKFAKYRYAFATENTAHPQYSLGYNSKIIDPLEARTVPIYYGCQDIEKYVPKECFIDFRNYGSFKAVDDYIQTISEDRYRQYIDAIDSFVCGGGLRPWSWQDLYANIERWYGSLRRNILVYCGVNNLGNFSRIRPLYDKCYGFDANPDKIAYAKEVYKTDPNVVMEFAALSDTDDSEVDFTITTDWDPAASIGIPNPEWEHVKSGLLKNQRTVKVPTMNLGKYCEQHGILEIDTLITDLQGVDFQAISTLDKLFNARKVREIQCEVEPDNTPQRYTGVSSSKLKDFQQLLSGNYDVLWVDPDPLTTGVWEMDVRWRAKGAEALHGMDFVLRNDAITPVRARRGKRMKDTVCVVFSKDRPMQLDACLRSLKRHCSDWESMDVKVLWTGYPPYTTVNGLETTDERPYTELVKENDFQSDLLSMVDGYDYVMFVTDDTMFVDEVDMGLMTGWLVRNPKALGVSLRLSKSVSYSYMENRPQRVPIDYNYKWADFSGDWGYPLELSSSLYRVADLMPLLEQPVYNSPNTLEAFLDWSKDSFRETRPELIYDLTACAFSNPVNKVQTVFTGNRSGTNPRYSINRLTNLFSQGYRVNVEKFDNFVPVGVHQEVPYAFVDRDGRVLVEQPEVSILILNYNGGESIKKCLFSIDGTLQGRDYEVLVWDNASTDGSLEWLKSLHDWEVAKKLTVIESPTNIGVQARASLIAIAKGEYITVCDNDVILTQGWLDNCIQWAKLIPDAGIIAPMTNYASGPQGVTMPVNYDVNNVDVDELNAFAAWWTEQPGHTGNFLQIWRLPSFFWFITPACLERIGNMRSFGKIFYEDDDYSIRASLAGLKVLINQGLYIHHTGGPQGRGDTQYAEWMEEAWVEFKRTWGLPDNMQQGSADYITWIMQNTVFNKDLHFIPILKESTDDEQEDEERQRGNGNQE